MSFISVGCRIISYIRRRTRGIYMMGGTHTVIIIIICIHFKIKLYIRPTSYGISCFFKTNYLRPIIIIIIIMLLYIYYYYIASTRYSVQCVGIIQIIIYYTYYTNIYYSYIHTSRQINTIIRLGAE